MTDPTLRPAAMISCQYVDLPRVPRAAPSFSVQGILGKPLKRTSLTMIMNARTVNMIPVISGKNRVVRLLLINLVMKRCREYPFWAKNRDK